MRHTPETPFELFGHEIGEGWMTLVKPIVDKIDELNQLGAQITITQIKAKFGELRVYIENGDEELYQMIRNASEKSRHICEHCGRPAEQSMINGWVYTLCPECLNTLAKRRIMGRTHKVVYNAAVCGGLYLSVAAVKWLKEHGFPRVVIPNDRHFEDKLDSPVPRHHPLLVKCVESLGEAANGGAEKTMDIRADLRIATIVGRYYYIDDHDGAGEEVIDKTKAIDVNNY